MERGVGVVTGDRAPTLTLRTAAGGRIALTDLRGQNIVLAFVSGSKFSAENMAKLVGSMRARLQSTNAATVVVSDERAWWAPAGGTVQVCSPPGEITSRIYGRDRTRQSTVLVIVDRDGVVQFARVGAAREGLTEGLSEAIETCVKRVCSAQQRAATVSVEWSALHLVATFALGLFESVLVSEPPAYRQGAGVGMSLNSATFTGSDVP